MRNVFETRPRRNSESEKNVGRGASRSARCFSNVPCAYIFFRRVHVFGTRAVYSDSRRLLLRVRCARSRTDAFNPKTDGRIWHVAYVIYTVPADVHLPTRFTGTGTGNDVRPQSYQLLRVRYIRKPYADRSSTLYRFQDEFQTDRSRQPCRSVVACRTDGDDYESATSFASV